MPRSRTASRADKNRSPLVAALALALLAVLVAITTTGMERPSGLISLAQHWTLIEEDGTRVPVEVPFRSTRHDLAWDRGFVLEQRLRVPTNIDEPSLLLSGIQGQVRVEANGRHLAHTGSWPDLSTRDLRGQLLISIPGELVRAEETVLRVHLQGAHGSAELWSRPLLGSRTDLERVVLANTGERLALVATLAIAATLGLVISAVRPMHQEFLWFGLFCIQACLVSFAHSDTWWLVSPNDDFRVRLHALSYSMLPGSGLLFLYQVILPWRRAWPAVPMLVGVIIAVIAVASPSTAIIPLLDLLTDIALLVCIAVGIWLLRRALLGGNHASASILLAVGILVVAAAAERLSIELDGSAPGLMLPAFLLFLGTTTAAMVLGRSDLADRYQELVSNARDAILVVQKDGRVEEANEASRRLLEREPVGKLLSDLIPDPELSSNLDPATAEGPGARRAELVLQGRNGSRTTVESVATALPEGRVLLVMRDLTARRKVEQGMVHAARMETVGIIAGGIAHDFNNTMTALMAHIGLLRMKITEPKEEERLLRMEAVIRRAAHMTRRLLTLARGGDKARRAVQPVEPVHSAVELTRSMLPRNVSIKERFQADLPLVLGSADDLEQAVLNLLVNARDALAPVGGTIRVSVAPYRNEGLLAGVRIVVEDDGPGIPDSIWSSIWEPFFTTKGEGRGTGLGLSVVARVVRDHGGRIELRRLRDEAPDGRYGTRFTITLPPYDQKPNLQVDTAGAGEQSVLVVEDEDEIREIIRAELSFRGYTVLAAASAEEALDLLSQRGAPVDLLVTDVVMGSMDGISLATRLCAQHPQLRVVIASGFIPQHNDHLSPSWERLNKPFTAEQLATAVRRALLSDLTTDETEERSLG